MKSEIGAIALGDSGCSFRVWAPYHEKVSLRIKRKDTIKDLPMSREDFGYHHLMVTGVNPGDRYAYVLGEGLVRPDPASRAQPEGVHEFSMVADHQFNWSDSHWRGLALEDYVFYELHTGSFTQEGTFEAAIDYLPKLVELGITCIEIMPVAAFPGSRNWGYDGVFPYAAQHSYGGLRGLQRLVDACHLQGLAVCLDVVYNHLGPEGNYLRDFAPYFSDKYRTPWGEAINFDEALSDQVKEFFLENIRWWIEDVHIDALRLDAVHAIFDQSANNFLTDAACRVREIESRIKRSVHIIAESDLHDPRMVRPLQIGGHGMDAEWNDDLHHSIHALVTEERDGYYRDFGSVADLAAVYNQSYAHAGEYSAFRERRHGSPALGIPAKRFVVCIQNHDQVGNRFSGDRLSTIAPFEENKLAAGAMLLSSYLPLIFMGEEYGETNPFLYFVDHGDRDLLNAVKVGRREEFASFGWLDAPPDPGSLDTFVRSKLNRSLLETETGKSLFSLYKQLISLRKSEPALQPGRLQGQTAWADEKSKIVVLNRRGGGQHISALLNFNKESISKNIPFGPGKWKKVLDSADEKWSGPGSRMSASMESQGEISIDIQAGSFVVFKKVLK